jgi:hypothetical protein
MIFIFPIDFALRVITLFVFPIDFTFLIKMIFVFPIDFAHFIQECDINNKYNRLKRKMSKKIG